MRFLLYVTRFHRAHASSTLTGRRASLKISLDFTGTVMRMTKIIIIIPGHDDWPFSSKIRKGELHLTESVCPRDFLGELEYWGLSALHIGLVSLLESVLTKILLSNVWDFSCRAVLCLHNATRCLAPACRRSRRPDCKKDSTKCHKKVKAQRKSISTRKTTLRVCGGQPYGGRSGGFWRTQIPRPLPRCRKNDGKRGVKNWFWLQEGNVTDDILKVRIAIVKPCVFLLRCWWLSVPSSWSPPLLSLSSPPSHPSRSASVFIFFLKT